MTLTCCCALVYAAEFLETRCADLFALVSFATKSWLGDSRYHVLDNVVLCGIIGSPSSMNMVCPDKIGRDSWDRGAQLSEVHFKFPLKNWGKKPSPIGGTSPV